MRHTKRTQGAITAAALLIALPALAAPAGKAPSVPSTAMTAPAAAPKKAASTRTAPLSQEEKIRHVLNRLAFGPRPGDIERVQKVGLQNWINEQLNPQSIGDGAVEARLASLEMLQLSPADLLHNYEAEKLYNRTLRRDAAKNAAAQNAAMPQNGAAMTDGTMPQNGAMQKDAASTRAPRQQRRRAMNAPQNDAMNANGTALEMIGNGAMPGENGAMPAGNGAMDAMPNGAAPQNANRVRRNNGRVRGSRLQAISVANLPADAFAALQPRQQQLLRDAEARGVMPRASVQAIGELVTARLLRATESNRQLNEVMVDFWSNHFNLDVKKGLVSAYKIADERDVIRPHIWGKFRDLLGASAKSPAMLYYLDNFRSTRTYDAKTANARPQNRRRAMMRRRAQNPNAINANAVNADAVNTDETQTPQVAPVKAKKARGGVNENYARELMELHTLGVNGGYTQKDVQEVARCLTGWTIDRQTGGFEFRANQHDDGEKVVLGQRIPAGGGQQDGERVLDILAKSPATAKHLARELCLRLVSDTPSDALVERVAQTFLKTDGDLRETVHSIVTSPEFFAPANYQTKIKSPFEYAVSSVRALGGHIKLPADANSETDDENAPQNGRLRRVALGGEQRAQARVLAVGAASLNSNQAVRIKTLGGEIATMGQPLFSYQAPTGYPETSDYWVSAGALVSRLNFALDVTGGAVVDVVANPADLTRGLKGDTPQPAIDRLGDILLSGELSASTRATLEKQFAPGTPPDPAKIAALLLGSPEFQRR